jgi:CDP-glucose 4,6-dehydratase
MKLKNKDLKKFYRNKKVLITGHTGFKGSWLCMVLKFFGANVYGYSLKDKKFKNLENLNIKKKIKTFDGDVSNIVNFERIIKKIKPEIVFHLAAQSLVKQSYKDSYKTFLSNTVGVLNILEIKKKNGFIKSLVIVTSDKCYKNKESNKGYNELSEIGGNDPYSGSKAAAEIIFNSYASSFNNSFSNTCSARAGNVIGGGDWSKNRIIPDVVKSIYKKKDFIIRNPNAIRPWQHVLEPLSGYIKLALLNYKFPNKFNSSWNFGPKKKINYSVKKVVEKFLKYSKKKITIKIRKNKDIKETKTLHLISNKAKSKINWQSKWSHELAIKQTAEWYNAYFLKKDMSKFTLKQIAEYFEK